MTKLVQKVCPKNLKNTLFGRNMDFFKNLKKLISPNIYARFKFPSSISAGMTAWTDKHSQQRLKKPNSNKYEEKTVSRRKKNVSAQI